MVEVCQLLQTSQTHHPLHHAAYQCGQGVLLFVSPKIAYFCIQGVVRRLTALLPTLGEGTICRNAVESLIEQLYR